MNLKFKVKHQDLIRTDKKVVVGKSQNYLKIVFDFITPDWEEYNKYAIISDKDEHNYNLPIIDNSITVPLEVLNEYRYFLISLYGENNTSRVTTNTKKVALRKSTYTNEFNSITDQDTVKDVFDYIDDKLEEITIEAIGEEILNGKADIDHTHIVEDITDFESAHDIQVENFCNTLANLIMGGE